MMLIDCTAAMADVLARPLDDELRQLLIIRRDQLAEYDLDLADMARIVIVEPQDTASAVEDAMGLPVTTNLVDGVALREGDFTPSWEYADRHPSGWTEIVFILSDDGFGHVLLIPEHESLDPALKALCLWATAATDQA